ncbi:MAG TPA: orotidine 5'-phosphate decarboxylase / HUMPS family protein, partial [Sphingomonadales bacterium]|nr:orotidine 5'-phosphate decarboxylase / HUMPS family protein [Sphingomonadales bacterium]
MRAPPAIFAALDTPDLARALSLAKTLKGAVGGLKLGFEFFSAQGPAGIRAVAGIGLPLFLDLKLHDIPNTVAGAVRALLPLKPAFLTLHAAGGAAMMEAAADAARSGGHGRPKLLAVTVL